MIFGSMSKIFMEAPAQDHPEMREEEAKVLRLEKARLTIEPTDGHYRRRLAFNVARLWVVDQSVILLDGPAQSLDPTNQEETSPALEGPGLPPSAAVYPSAGVGPGLQPGLAFIIGLILIVGPCISLWLSHKLIYSKLSGLKLSPERLRELQQDMVATMSQDFLLRFCLPLIGAVISYYARPHHAILKHADKLVSAQTKQNEQHLDNLVHDTLEKYNLSLEEWGSYITTRIHAATVRPSLAPPTVEWTILENQRAFALGSIEPMMPESLLESAVLDAEPYVVGILSGGAQACVSSTPRDQVGVGRLVPGNLTSRCTSEYSFSVQRESSILHETLSVADGDSTEPQSSSSAVVIDAEQTPSLPTTPNVLLADATAIAANMPMGCQIPLTPERVQGTTQSATLAITRTVALHGSPSTEAMSSRLEALLAYWPLVHRPQEVSQLKDEEKEATPMTVLHVYRVITDIPEMPTIVVGSTSSSASSDSGLVSASVNALEISDTLQTQASENQAPQETDPTSLSQYGNLTATSDSSIPSTTQLDLESVEEALSSPSSTLSFSTTLSPSLSAQEQIIAAHPPTMVTTKMAEDYLSTRFRDLTVHMVEAGPTRVNSPNGSEYGDSPAATIAAIQSDSRSDFTFSTSSSTLSAASAPAPRFRPSHPLVPPTFATAGRFQFSSSNEASSEEGDGGDFGHNEPDNGDPVHDNSSGDGNQHNIHRIETTPVDNNHSRQQEVQSHASMIDSEEDNVERDEHNFKIVRPVVRLRLGYRLRTLHHEDLFFGFDSVGVRLGEHDHDFQQRRSAGLEESQERRMLQLDSVSSSTRGLLRVRKPDPRDNRESSRHCLQDTGATGEETFVKHEMGGDSAMTQVGGLARGDAHVQDARKLYRAAQMQGFAGVAGDKAEIKEEDEQDNGRGVETQAMAYRGQWQSVRSQTQHPTFIMAPQDRRESVLQLPLPLHPPPFPPRPPHRPFTFLRNMPLGRDSTASSSAAPPPSPQRQPFAQQARLVTGQSWITQQPPPQHLLQQSLPQQSLSVGGAPIYNQQYITTATTDTSTGAGAGEDESNPTRLTEQAPSLLLCAPFTPKFDSDDDDEIPLIVAVRVPNSRSGLHLPFQNQADHNPMFEGQQQQQQQQQQIPSYMLPLMSQDLHHSAMIPQPSMAAMGTTGATFGLGGGGTMASEMGEDGFLQIMESVHSFGQRLVAQEMASMRSWHARHEQDQMYTSKNNVVSYTSEPSSSSTQQPFHQPPPQQQAQQPPQYQAQPQLPLQHNQQQHQLHQLHSRPQQPLQPQHQPRYQDQHQEQEGDHLSAGGQQQRWSQTTYDPIEDLDGDNGVDSNTAFLSARQFQDPRQLQQQHEHHHLQSTTNSNGSGGNQFIGETLTPPVQPWLTGSASSSQYPSSRAIHPRLIFQQQQQLHQQIRQNQVLHQRQQQQIQQQFQQRHQLQQQYMLPNQQGFNSGQHQHQHQRNNPSQTPKADLGFLSQQYHQHQQQAVEPPSPQIMLASQDKEVQLQREYQQILQEQQQQQLGQYALHEEEQRQLLEQLQTQVEQRTLQRSYEMQGQDPLTRALVQSQSQEQARLGMTLAQQVQVQQVQVQQSQGLPGLQGQWEGGLGGGSRGGLGQARVNQIPLPSLMTTEQNRQLGEVLYGADKQELGEEENDEKEQHK
ncbi:hypothetical protein BG015_005406 [Linnemannia schmuckeri]|uniref:Uncharacterized protein n=1 Tax=Linnemannia schmuckeri TaxID=64567 RepID=A0A9P5S3I1_9FUNG|nr:hypothetical protein BG015_005406 [Linnemannia schmuckeri]